MLESEFISYLKENGLRLSSHQLEQLNLYQRLLKSKNEVMNLTSIVEKEEVFEKHFLDSLLFSFGEDFNNKKGIDVGTGAGFPGLVLAISYPNFKVTLLEPLNKRCLFLKEVVDKLKLDNVEIVNARAEDYCKDHMEEFDYAFARAVSSLSILLEIIIPLVKVNGYFIALKGKKFQEEINENQNALKELNCHVEKVKESFLPSEKDVRGNIFFKKDQKTSKKYPRNFSQIKKRPL
ncbi:MAG: 16S rRNA (guanine(527)-N(7))-methyltransferase RsmG [Bacillales bacterium]|nr:16S rRNA (guanine(527)-N(7))-methyltransferase RsmG [Bacillales bacterium]